MPRSSRIVPCLVLLACTVAAPVMSEEPAADPMAELMAAMAPGEHHEHLKKTLGSWKTEGKFWLDPASPEPVLSNGTATFKPAMDGRYVVQDYKAEFMGEPFHGVGTTGYDTLKGQYVATWIDNMSTTIYIETGSCDGEGVTNTYTGSMPDPASGVSLKTRTLLTVHDDTMVMETWMTPPDGGDDYKTMEIRNKRTGR